MRAAPRQVLRDLPCSRSTLIDVSYPPCTEFPTHEHTAAYLALVVRGVYDEWQTRSRTALAGEIIEYAAGSRHAVRTRAEPVRVLHVAIGDGAFPAHAGRAGMMWQLAREAVGPEDDTSRLVTESLALELLEPGSNDAHPDGGRPAWLVHATARLRDDYASNVTLRSLAHEAALHPSHFAREFRRWTGMTAGAFLRRVRVAAALHRLSSSAEPAARIAIEAGFADQSHMGRLFRRYVGASPSAFRTIAGRARAAADSIGP